MRPVLFGAAAVLIVLGAAALTAPTHDFVVGQGWREIDPRLPDREFLKVFRRLLLVPLVALIVLALRPWRDGDAASSGLKPVRPALFAQGFAATLGVGVCVLALHLANGWQVFERDVIVPGDVAARWARGLLLGVGIAVAEEWFFRAWMWTRLGRATAPLRSAAITSAIFGALHAFRSGALEGVDIDHDMAGALEALGHWVLHLFDPVAFGPLFIGLFLFGMLLSGLFRSCGSLWLPIGVHAAGVLLVYGHGELTDGGREVVLAGSRRLFDGAPGWIVLALGAWLAWRAPAAPAPDPD